MANNTKLAKLAPHEIQKRNQEYSQLANLQRGTQIGDFVAVCRTDYVQPYNDQWITRFGYGWVEHLLLVKNLLTRPDDLSVLVYLPEDLSEVYFVDVPAQSPDYRHLTQQGVADYELYPGYEQRVNDEIAKDYAIPANKAIFHSVDQQTGDWSQIVSTALEKPIGRVEVEYNGVKYTYEYPQDEDEAAKCFWAAQATRRGAYPGEETLAKDRKFDIVPAIPDGVTGTVYVKEFIAVEDKNNQPPFRRLSFQRTEVPPDLVLPGQPDIEYHISFGNDVDDEPSIADYLARKYAQMGYKNPTVKFVSLT